MYDAYNIGLNFHLRVVEYLTVIAGQLLLGYQ